MDTSQKKLRYNDLYPLVIELQASYFNRGYSDNCDIPSIFESSGTHYGLATISGGTFRSRPFLGTLSDPGVAVLASSYSETKESYALGPQNMINQGLVNYYDPNTEQAIPIFKDTLVKDEQDEFIEYMLKNENVEFHPPEKTINFTIKIKELEHIVPQITIDDEE